MSTLSRLKTYMTGRKALLPVSLVLSALSALTGMVPYILIWFIIAHRMRTVANAYKIVVLENGRVAESGSPEELKNKKGSFARMVGRQMTVAIS
ncbi:MAG: hypothetical protein PVF73_02210 [Bacteroidales bacterium]|jgi:ABC-type multidrug transport system fused ATPase/permease subunit